MSDFREHAIPRDILDELSARFIINIPQEERKDLIRVCFQVESAHWFYIDFYVDDDKNKARRPDQRLQAGTIKEFAHHIFKHVPFLQPEAHRVEQVIEEWREYKLAVPTFGAIIMNKVLDKVLLVQGYMAKSSWGFPKGKVNEEELPHVCAVREVLEETGFDISDRIDPNEYLEQVINDQMVRLYLIDGVPEDTVFEPQTRCEIRALKFFEINRLPTSKTDQQCKIHLKIPPNSFFMVIPFLRDLKKWVGHKHRERMQFLNEEPAKPRAKKKSESRDKVGRGQQGLVQGAQQQQQQQQLLGLLGLLGQGQQQPGLLGHSQGGAAVKQNSSGKKVGQHQRKESERGQNIAGSATGPAGGGAATGGGGGKRKASRQNSGRGGEGQKQDEAVVRQQTTEKSQQSKKKDARNNKTVDNSGKKNVESNSARKSVERNVENRENRKSVDRSVDGSSTRKSVERSVDSSSTKKSVDSRGSKSASKQSRRQLLFNEVRRGQKKEDGGKLRSGIFEENFCPEAWKNFRLDHDEILMAVAGLPTQFVPKVKSYEQVKILKRR